MEDNKAVSQQAVQPAGETEDSSQEYQIDLGEIFSEIRKHLLMVILAAVICGGFSFFVSKVLITPTYQSTSMMYVLNSESTTTSVSDIQVGTQLLKDYSVLVTNRTVMEQVIDNLNLTNISYKALQNRISVTNPDNTRILEITVTDTDPEEAAAIVNEVAECASSYIADSMSQEAPKIIEKGVVPTEPSGPNTKKNTVIGAVVGILIALIVIVIRTVTNDTIKTEDDVTRYFNLPVLAVIPEKDEIDSKKNKSSHSR